MTNLANEPIPLPQAVIDLYKAQQAVFRHYAHTKLKFTLDGRLIGDIGEAIAIEHFGMTRTTTRERGVDGDAPDGTKLQIKATQFKTSGPAFSIGEKSAKLLLFMWIDFESGVARVRYNGPEAPIRKHVPVERKSTFTVKIDTVLGENELVAFEDRLPRLK